MTKEEAEQAFRDLISKYGIFWRYNVPAEAYTKLADINKILTWEDRRRIAKEMNGARYWETF